MKYIKLFESFNDGKELDKPSLQVLLDGTSSSGKSASLKKLPKEFCVLAVDSFYNLMYEQAGLENFGNNIKISELYPNCPYDVTPNSKGFEKAARWYMAQEVKFGKIWENDLRNAEEKKFGRSPNQSKIIYDDVESLIIKETKKAGLGETKWILIHAPIDHSIKNIKRRNKVAGQGRPLDLVLMNAYCYKFEAKPTKGGADPEKSWTFDSLTKSLEGTEELLLSDTRDEKSLDENWIEKFIKKLGVKGKGKYWIHSKFKPDVVVNSRNEDGGQKTIAEMSEEIQSEFN